jgi:hypothetical protein
MVHFRKRFDKKMLARMNELIVQRACHFGKPEKLSAAQWIFAGLGV